VDLLLPITIIIGHRVIAALYCMGTLGISQLIQQRIRPNEKNYRTETREPMSRTHGW